MTEPKQSFTEEVEKEAREYCVNDAFVRDECGYDKDQRIFTAGANAALSILSRGGEGREFWIADEGDWSNLAYNSERKYDLNVMEGATKIHAIEYSALVAERARNAELERQIEARKSANVDSVEIIDKLETENAALKMEIEDLKQAFEYGRKSFNKANNYCVDLMEELATLRARADAFTELSNKLAAQLALCKEQRNYLSLYRANDQYDCSDEIKQYDLELQKKGQGDE